MYALEDLLNTRGEDSVTSGPCVWVRRPRANTQACAVRDLVIEKAKRENGSKFTLKTSKQMSVPLKIQIHQLKSIYEILLNDCATYKVHPFFYPSLKNFMALQKRIQSHKHLVNQTIIIKRPV